MSISQRHSAAAIVFAAAIISVGGLVAVPAGAGVVADQRGPSVADGPDAPPGFLPNTPGRAQTKGAAARAVQRPATPATPVYAPKGRPLVTGNPSKAGTAAPQAFFFYGGVRQRAEADGVTVDMTISRPVIAVGDHSLAELAVMSADGQQIVEVGWTVDPGVNPGSDRTHLFVFHWVNGRAGCYNGCGFVPQPGATVRPGTVLPDSVFGQKSFMILHDQGRWWVGYNAEWFGYFPDSLWGGGFTRAGFVQAFGEVATTSSPPCTDMGNGRFAERPGAARISGIAYWSGPAVNVEIIPFNNPELYTARLFGTSGAHFGGPGTGPCPR